MKKSFILQIISDYLCSKYSGIVGQAIDSNMPSGIYDLFLNLGVLDASKIIDDMLPPPRERIPS